MICFDFDGVIADSLSFWEENCRISALEQGVTLPAEFHPYRRLDPLNFVQLATELGLDPAQFSHRMSKLGIERGAVVEPFPGIPDVLEKLALKTKLSVISASQSSFIAAFLKVHGMTHLFHEIIGGDRHSGKAGALRNMLNPIAMVGDAKSDVDAAKEAAVTSVATSWGWQEIEMIEHADYLAKDPRELLTILSDLADG